MARTKSNASAPSTATIGFEAKLWLTADKLRNNMDAAEYSRAERDRLPKAARRVGAEAPINHVVLGLIFLKYISDTAGKCRMSNAEIRARNARPIRHSKFVIRHFPTPTIGKSVDDAKGGRAQAPIERDNPRLKGVLPKDYARPGFTQSSHA